MWNPITSYADYAKSIWSPIINTGKSVLGLGAEAAGIKSTPSRNYGDYNGDWLQYLKDMAADGDEASIDRLMQYMMQEQSNQTARDWTANREDTAIQRFSADARAAGFNPQALLMQGGNPIASSSSGSSYSSNNYLNSYRYQSQTKIAWASLILGFAASIFKSTIGAVGGLGKAGLGAAL